MSVKAPAVLFDLDGVLVDSRTPIARSLNFALERHGIEPFPEPVLHGLIGPPLDEAFAELLREREAPLDLTPACVEAYRERYEWACIEETLPFEGMAALLHSLEPTRTLAVATSKPVEFSRPILETLDLAHFFEAIVGPPLGPTGERKARTVERALRTLETSDAVMIGDRRHDVAAGRAHALVTVGVLWGCGSERELRDAGVDHLVACPAELEALLGSGT